MKSWSYECNLTTSLINYVICLPKQREMQTGLYRLKAEFAYRWNWNARTHKRDQNGKLFLAHVCKPLNESIKISPLNNNSEPNHKTNYHCFYCFHAENLTHWKKINPNIHIHKIQEPESSLTEFMKFFPSFHTYEIIGLWIELKPRHQASNLYPLKKQWGNF